MALKIVHHVQSAMVIQAGRSEELNCELDVLSAFYPPKFLTDYTGLFLLPCTSVQPNISFKLAFTFMLYLLFFLHRFECKP